MRAMRRARQGKAKLAKASRHRAAPSACRLVIMAKLPVAGRVKTRLAREAGTVEATRFYRTTLHAVLARLGRQPFWQTLIAVSPDSGVASPMLLPGIGRIPQGSGDLGARMHRPMRKLPPGPVCVIGTDIPAVGVTDIRRAFRLLGRADAVFGPAEDGGFWLIGMRRRRDAPWPYEGVRWSRPDTLEAVLANLPSHDVAMATRLADVDTATELRLQNGRFGRRIVTPA